MTEIGVVRRTFQAALLSIGLAASSSLAHAQTAELRFGIVGTDSTHAVEFTRILNDRTAKDHVPAARVTAAYRGGSAALPISRDRIGTISDTLRTKWSIPFVAAIGDLCQSSDALLLLSVDVSLRMEEVREAAACGKPLFIDKPLSGSLADARAIATYLDRQHIPWFSSSSLRYGHAQHVPNLVGADTWGPGKYIEGFPLDLTYYGIHSIESMFSLMGPGVAQVSELRTADTTILQLTWMDGRVGIVRLVHAESEYGGVLFHEGGSAEPMKLSSAYAPLVTEIVRFARSGQPPVANEETLEIFAVMDAAQKSLQAGGLPVRVGE